LGTRFEFDKNVFVCLNIFKKKGGFVKTTTKRQYFIKKIILKGTDPSE